MRAKRTPYQRIIQAAKRGTGVRLTPEDVRMLASDPAISTLAMHQTKDTDKD